jgi:hypothetical protein
MLRSAATPNPESPDGCKHRKLNFATRLPAAAIVSRAGSEGPRAHFFNSALA